MNLNRSQMAEALGIQPGTLDAWIREGCPVEDRPGQGKAATFNAPAVIRWHARREADRALAKAETTATAEEIDALKAERLRLDNELRELTLAKAKGEVAPVAEIGAAIGRRVIAARSALMEHVPHRCAAEIETRPGASVREIVRKEMRAALTEISERGLIEAFAECGFRVGVADIIPCATCQGIVAELDLIDREGVANG